MTNYKIVMVDGLQDIERMRECKRIHIVSYEEKETGWEVYYFESNSCWGCDKECYHV